MAQVRRALAVAAGGVLTASLAGAAFADVSEPASDPRAVQLLAGAADAGRTTSYVGTQVVMLWSDDSQRSATVQVSHRAGTGSLIEVEPTATTAAHRSFEPDGVASAATAGLSAQVLALVAQNFVVTLAGSGEVIGRATDVVAVDRPDGTAAQRLWIDRDTRLVLRRKFYDSAGELVRQTAFVTLQPTTPDFTGVPMPQTLQAADRSTQQASGADLSAFGAAGWRLPSAPAGMVVLANRVEGSGDDQVLHVTYSDGLGTLSLFEQRGRLDASGLADWDRDEIGGVPVYVSQGYPRRIVWDGGDRVYTVVAECRDPAVEHVVRSLPRGHSAGGLDDRVGRGARRVGSWINPFG
ncbi:MAG TPA: sigma-E factor regulatory protein RseB domain-containing protein [Mycobacteriales bacterium]|nr:sigma-E factor regulatory protein RseB domain-containing protein [Mycobacteriales bacterium]